jgi:hypothetical protein
VIPPSLRGRVAILSVRGQAAMEPSIHVLLTQTTMNDPSRADLDVLGAAAQAELAKPGIRPEGFRLTGLPASMGTSVWVQEIIGESNPTRISAFGFELETIRLGRVAPAAPSTGAKAVPAGTTRLLIVPRIVPGR